MADFNSIRFEPNRPLLREISAERLNAILQEIKRNRPLPGRGISVRQEGYGVRIDSQAQPARAVSGTPIARQPWDLVVGTDPASESNPPAYLVSVRPGTLNGILPSNWSIQQSIEADDANLYYAKAVIATDGQDITGVTIEIDTSPPTAQEPVEFGIQNPVKYLFGLFLEGAVYRVIGAGHITISPKLWLTTEKQTLPAPGELPFLQYFTLR